jgi:hypothetical protein
MITFFHRSVIGSPQASLPPPSSFRVCRVFRGQFRLNCSRLTYDTCLDRIAAAAKATGIQAGILVRSRDDLPDLLARGFTHFAIESDLGIVRMRYQQVLKGAREL